MLVVVDGVVVVAAAASVVAYLDTSDRPDHIMQVSYDVDDNTDKTYVADSGGGGGGGGGGCGGSLISHRKLEPLMAKPIFMDLEL